MPTVPSNARQINWGVNVPSAGIEGMSVGITSDDDMLNMLTGTDRDNYLAAMEIGAQAMYDFLAANYPDADGRFVYTQTTITIDDDWPSA